MARAVEALAAHGRGDGRLVALALDIRHREGDRNADELAVAPTPDGVGSVVAVGFVVAMTLRYREALTAVAPADWLAWVALGAVWLIVLIPTAVLLAGPLRERRARA